MSEKRYGPSNAQLVAALKGAYPQIKSGHFVHALIEAFAPDLDLAELEEDFRRVPDGYAIYAEDRSVDVFEAEATHALHHNAMADYLRLWRSLDMESITLTLYIVSRHGHINAVNLLDIYLNSLGTQEFYDVPDIG